MSGKLLHYGPLNKTPTDVLKKVGLAGVLPYNPDEIVLITEMTFGSNPPEVSVSRPITPERAKELYRSKGFSSLLDCMYNKGTSGTDEEEKFVNSVWHLCPGHYCYMDALARICKNSHTRLFKR